MLYKTIDSKEKEITQLRELLNKSKSPKQKALIKVDLQRIENGYRAEKDNAYYLDFSFKDSPKDILVHDIRIEYNGKVAQIDHVIINRFGIEVIESKSFSGKLTIKGDGSLNVEYGEKVRTFPNPIEQNNRHVKLLLEFLKKNKKLPSNLKLFGIQISSTVIINPKTTLINDTLPKGFLRADSFTTDWNSRANKMGTMAFFRTMSLDQAKDIANFLVTHHKPKSYDYSKKYFIKKEKKLIKDELKIHLCSKCQSSSIEILYGKYGYFFKCLKCNGNSSIKLTCSNSNCKPKLKKNKLNFYQVCNICGMNELFFTNLERVDKVKM